MRTGSRKIVAEPVTNDLRTDGMRNAAAAAREASTSADAKSESCVSEQDHLDAADAHTKAANVHKKLMNADQMEEHFDKANDHRIAAKKLQSTRAVDTTKNSSVQILKGDVTANVWSDAARAAAVEARRAAMKASAGAEDEREKGDGPGDTADMNAASLHRDAANKFRSGGNSRMARQHDMLAADHEARLNGDSGDSGGLRSAIDRASASEKNPGPMGPMHSGADIMRISKAIILHPDSTPKMIKDAKRNIHLAGGYGTKVRDILKDSQY